MLYLYLDESGDLGFDFVNKKPSNYFTICVLEIKGHENDRALAKAVRAVLHRRVFPRSRGGSMELKGNLLPLEIKRYFYEKAGGIAFRLHFVTLNKPKVYAGLPADKERIYNYVSRLALEGVNFRDAEVRVIMTVDKSRSKQGIAEFNSFILSQVKARVDPRVPLNILHRHSQETPGLQAADLFAWGVFRKHEKGDLEWYGVFRGKIASEKLCLP